MEGKSTIARSAAVNPYANTVGEKNYAKSVEEHQSANMEGKSTIARTVEAPPYASTVSCVIIVPTVMGPEYANREKSHITRAAEHTAIGSSAASAAIAS